MNDRPFEMTAPAGVYRDRRAALGKVLDRPLLIPAGFGRPRQIPTFTMPFRASSHYLYFGGPPVPGACLVLEPGTDGHAGCYLLRTARSAEDAVWEGASPSDAFLADGAGLAVEALGGAPGVYSARYAGPRATDADNNAKLLDALEGQAQRSAAFCCVLAFVRDAEDPQPVLAEGLWQGQILQGARGEGGFGYDPLFLDPALGSSAAELDPATKTAHSHRGRAVAALIQALSAA